MKLTVTLTGQLPLTICLPNWPVIAWAHDHSQGGGAYLVVRRQRDKAAVLIYALYLSKETELRGGKLLPAGASRAAVIDAINLIGDDMIAQLPDDHTGCRIFRRLMDSCCSQLRHTF
jgi:hypothetical protein